MDQFLVWAAAALSIGAVVAHVIVGGRTFVRPLLASELPPQQLWTAYFAWHVATLTFSLVAVGFVAGAVSADLSAAATLSTVVAIAITLIGLLICIRARLSPLTFAPVLVYSVVAVFGVLSEIL